jgi:3D (Asp-Asp-Asp) domain-containing protein/peptidoglycan hydrolase CwlO-like protein
VRGPGRGFRTLCAGVLCGVAVGALLPAGGGAETADDLEAQADALRARNQTLAAGSQSALASLTTIESRLAQARAELASFRARSAKVREKRRLVSEELRVVRGALRATNRALAGRLQTLYEHEDDDVLGVILGAGSLDEAISAVETLDLAVRQDEDLLAQAQHVTKRLAHLRSTLAARQRELDQLAAVKAAATTSLLNARAERLQALASLRAERSANAGRIEVLDDRARTLASQYSPSTPAVTPDAPRLPTGPASAAVHSITVHATAYALNGRTASGRSAGWGSVAVDPSVIPLGSRLAIPGYGMGVASDTGGGIVGPRIDVWFPTEAQANEWGSRVVTVTVYPN